MVRAKNGSDRLRVFEVLLREGREERDMRLGRSKSKPILWRLRLEHVRGRHGSILTDAARTLTNWSLRLRAF